MRIRCILLIIIFILAVGLSPLLNHSLLTATEHLKNNSRQATQGAIIDVKRDFGAKGDGKTDDTHNLQNALNNGNGKIVYFPSGTYLISDKLSFPDNITIVGDGIEKTSLKTISGNIFHVVKSRSNIKISDISFIGNKTGEAILINLAYMKNALIERCRFEKSDIKCVLIQYSSNITIKDCEITESSGSGMVFSGVSGLAVTDCYSHNNGLAGISITGIGSEGNGCNNFIIDKNKSLNNGTAGITITGYSYNGKITNNICNNNGAAPDPKGQGDGINSHRLHSVIISNNICNNNGGNGVGLNGQDEKDNTSCQYVTVTGNTCTGNKFSGIKLYYTQYCTIDNNICFKNECVKAIIGGITLDGATYNKIINNKSHDNGVVEGKRCSDILLQSNAGHNILDNNAIGSIERNDETEDITIRSTDNYIGSIDYTHFKWGATPGKTPIYISDLTHQEYSTDIVKTAISKEFTLANVIDEDDYIFLDDENAGIVDASIIYTEATSPDPGVIIKLGTIFDEDYFGIQATESTKEVGAFTAFNLVGNKRLTAGTQLRVHSDNKKAGTGKIKIKVRLMTPTYYR